MSENKPIKKIHFVCATGGHEHSDDPECECPCHTEPDTVEERAQSQCPQCSHAQKDEAGHYECVWCHAFKAGAEWGQKHPDEKTTNGIIERWEEHVGTKKVRNEAIDRGSGEGDG